MSLIDDIKLELGDATPSDGLLDLWVRDALSAIERRASRLGRTVLDEDRDYAARVAVVAHAQNPAAATQVDVAIDDSRVSRRMSSSAGRVSVPEGIWDEIGLAELVVSDWSGSIPYGRGGCW